MSDSFKTIVYKARSETKVKGSHFIASACPASTKGEAEKFIQAVKKEFFDATHNCYAYRLGIVGNQFRVNDDGEPGGSAGKPILASIDQQALTDVVVLVTRYFGGTKLGVGGLRRAYGEAAGVVLTKAEHVTRFSMESISAAFPHSRIGSVMQTISLHEAKIIDTVYDEEVHLTIEVRQSVAGKLSAALIEATSGNVSLRPIPRP